MDSVTNDSGTIFIENVVSIWGWLQGVVSAFWGGLDWPHAILIIFSVVIIFFRGEIKGVIPRIKRIGADGFEVESPVPPVQPSTSVSALQNLPKGDFTHSFGIVLNAIKEQIKDMDQAEALQFLLADDAGWRVTS